MQIYNQHKQKTQQQQRKHYLGMKQNETFPRALFSLTGGEKEETNSPLHSFFYFVLRHMLHLSLSPKCFSTGPDSAGFDLLQPK